MSGRAISAVLTLAIQLALVRLLSVSNYGAYVTLIAGLDLTIVFGTLGLHWAVARYLPEYRLSASGPQTQRFVLRLFALRSAVLLVAAAAWLVAGRSVLDAVGLDVSGNVVPVLAGLLVMQGLGQFLRDNVLGALLQQRVARASQVARQFCWLALLGLASWWYAAGSVVYVLTAELIASALSAAIAFKGLWTDLQSDTLRKEPREGWKEPTGREVWGTSARVYAADLVTLAYSGQALTVMLQRFAGNEAAAVFGFVRVLLVQLSRYLPASLLFSLIQPKLTASYVGGGGMRALNINANLAGKLSHFALMPVVAISAVRGDVLIDALSGGRFAQTGLLFFVAMLGTIPGSQGQLAYTVAVVSGHSGFCTLASVAGLFVLPLMWLLLLFQLGPWAAVISMCLSSTLVVGTLTLALVARTSYRPEGAALLKLGVAAVGASVFAALAPQHANPWWSLVSAAVIVLATYGALSWTLKPFSLAERAKLNDMLGRRLFSV